MEESVKLMRKALQLAQQAAAMDEVPIGALIIHQDCWIGEGFNQNISNTDPTAHAEMVALREACRFSGNHRIPGAEIFITLEPCPMCFFALVQARVKRITYGASDPKGGFSRFFSDRSLNLLNHRPEIVSGLCEEECSDIISSFFQKKRLRGKRKWLKN